MKNEDFDEAIRQKLEGLDQSYSEADVDKVFRHVTKPPGGLFHWLGRHWYVPVLSVAALVGISYLLLLMLNPDKTEIKQAEVVKPATEVAVQENVSAADQKTETNIQEVKPEAEQSLSLTSQTSISADNSKPVTSTIKVTGKESKTVKETKTVKQESIASVSNTTSQKKEILAEGNEKATKPSEVANQKPSANEESKVENIKTKEAVNISEAPKPVPADNQVAEAANATKPGKTVVSEESKALTEETSDAATQPEVKSDKNQTAGATEPGNAGSGAAKLNPPAEEKGKNPSKPGWDWSLKPQSGIRIAGTLPLSNQSIGGAFTGEKLFGKHFGVSLGIAYNSTFTEKFTDKKDLDKRSHHPVDPHMDDRLGDDEHPTNISIHNTIYQVPLHISYYHQLKPGVAFSLSAGTDIDFFVKQNIVFDITRDSIHGERHHFQNNGTVDPFNSIVISAGMEKQWKRLGLMIQPFIVPHLKQVFYKPKEFEYGFGIQLNYSLFK
ncbi:MAG: hypothetical protein IPH88_11410 [Bacteroidales bacterium]|nr:hypothetical protein [Bacteroidales bacterium]